MFKLVLIVIVILLAALLVFAATRPDSFRVERSVEIQAAPARIYPQLADFHRWQAWSPWEKLDPAMTRTFSGADSGTGAVYAWDSQGKAGAGRMEITESTAPNQLVIQLDFIKPFQARNTAEFTLETHGGATRVRWAMYGSRPYLVKVMQVFVDMDRLVGRDFETGLANLKAASEQP